MHAGSVRRSGPAYNPPPLHAWQPSRYTTAAAGVAGSDPTPLRRINTACGVPPSPHMHSPSPHSHGPPTLPCAPPPPPGMAGSGKTTLIQQINAYLHGKQQPGYIINLDPAVTHMPYPANIDIRDTVRLGGGGGLKDCAVTCSILPAEI